MKSSLNEVKKIVNLFIRICIHIENQQNHIWLHFKWTGFINIDFQPERTFDILNMNYIIFVSDSRRFHFCLSPILIRNTYLWFWSNEWASSRNISNLTWLTPFFFLIKVFTELFMIWWLLILFPFVIPMFVSCFHYFLQMLLVFPPFLSLITLQSRVLIDSIHCKWKRLRLEQGEVKCLGETLFKILLFFIIWWNAFFHAYRATTTK